MYSYTNNPTAPPSGLDPSGFKTDPNSGLGPLTSWADQVWLPTPMSRLIAEPTEQKASEYEERGAQLVSMQFGSEEEEAKAGDQELGPLPVTS